MPRIFSPLIASALLCCNSWGESAPQPATPATPEELAKQEKKESIKSDLTKYFPEGATLVRVSLPRYDKNKLAMLAMADKIFVLPSSVLRAETFRVKLINDSPQPPAVFFTEEARYSLLNKWVISNKPTYLMHSGFYSQGHGIQCDTTTRCGFMTGPIRSVIDSSQFIKSPK